MGTMAESTTTATSSENWSRSMMPAVSPYRELMVPKVSPVDMSKVVKAA